VVAWRSTAALAQLAVGNAQRAIELAAEELERARRAGCTRLVIRDLRVLGVVQRSAAGIELLSEAVELGGRHPIRLEYLQALVDLGAALRRPTGARPRGSRCAQGSSSATAGAPPRWPSKPVPNWRPPGRARAASC
jgi:hypothetical protein